MNVLVSNVGSTSLKCKLFQMPEETVLFSAHIDRIGGSQASFVWQDCRSGRRSRTDALRVPDYAEGIRLLLEAMTGPEGAITGPEQIGAVGFKTVLAEGYHGVHLLTEPVMEAMRRSLPMAPVHNAAYLQAIDLFRRILPETPLVGVFETAFHTTIPLERRLYAVPYEWYERYGLARLGYHGASHAYIARQAPALGPARRVISCHLGGSSSLCAILDGRSVDTSFGFSLQTGVPHATRAGDTDVCLAPYLLDKGLAWEQIMDGLSKKGGLLGLSGVSGDMRQVQQAAEAGNQRAQLAIDVFVCSVVRYIGMFFAELGGLDQLVFTGGIGENAWAVRERIGRAVSHLGIEISAQRNKNCRSGVISADGSPVLVSVVPANEELGVARESYRCAAAIRT